MQALFKSIAPLIVQKRCSTCFGRSNRFAGGSGARSRLFTGAHGSHLDRFGPKDRRKPFRKRFQTASLASPGAGPGSPRVDRR